MNTRLYVIALVVVSVISIYHYVALTATSTRLEPQLSDPIPSLPHHVILVYKLDWKTSLAGIKAVGAGAGELVLFDTAVRALRYISQHYPVNLTVEIHESPETMEHALDLYNGNITSIITEAVNRFSPRILAHFERNKCLYRLLEYWGTPEIQNHPRLNLNQYLTPYRYNSSNTFLGIYTSEDTQTRIQYPSPPRICLHGKVMHLYTQYVLDTLRTLQNSTITPFEFHATISDRDIVAETERKTVRPLQEFAFIHNHGILTGNGNTNDNDNNEWLNYLSSCSAMIGIGEPYAGPAVLDAISQGAFYIDYKYAVPRTFLGVNPDITLHSQHQFAIETYGSKYIAAFDWRDMNSLVYIVQRRLEQRKRLRFVHPDYQIAFIASRLYDNVIKSNFCGRSSLVTSTKYGY